MANVPYRTDKILEEEVKGRNATAESVLQHISGAVNYCLDKALIQYVDAFTSGGTWVCPSDVTRVFLYGCGGGGGGQGGTGNGGGASIPHLVALDVTPSASYVVTIGIGGSGNGPTTGNLGFNGGDTAFGSLYIYRGGLGGGQPQGYFYQMPGGIPGNYGPSFSIYSGGHGSFVDQTSGGGGAAALGNGGKSGWVATGPIYGGAASAGSGYGSGGGGGFGGFGINFPYGAAGAPGVLYVIYYRSNI